MNNRKRWANKEEAEKYIEKCFRTNNFGLSYCAACDYLGLVPNEYKEEVKGFRLGVWSDCLFCDLRDLISNLQYEVYNSEYVENHKNREVDEYLETAEDYLAVAKAELKSSQEIDENYLKHVFMEDEELMRYVSELKDIKASHDSYRLLHDYGRIYNDALNYLDIMYQLDGDTTIETLDRLLAKEEQK